ncbi:Glycosyltransferase involved in cell wall bisynthesis [Desulfurella multipotens]|uniref:Glycosyltransferase involved in cell wall bisynthesis n=1 Tax=Desulfurella multipotens TaxID=79269 RepID=A0A1G6N4K6_9BACT|nr:glycosyltransferase family 2 protein [Desulfurella multipotens]SDC62166.1 Glycosyltransferase involved in cell wall bisynthesis [Desulfurella multipotens]
MSIGCAIITYNEKENLERTLKSVDFCDEIVIVDSYSTDETVEIAKKYTDKIYLNKFISYGEQKNFAIEKLSTDWILSIDADEVVSPSLKTEILNAIKNSKFDSYYIKIQLVFLNKALRFGGAQNWHLRLFRKGLMFSNCIVHEKVISKNASYLKGKILHYSYKDLSHYIEKLNKYTSISATLNLKKNQHLHPIIRFQLELLKRFIFKGAFLDGYEGILYALLSSFYQLVKYAKAKELN